MTVKKKMRSPSMYNKQVLSLLDEYESETGDHSGDLLKAAKWLRANNKMDPPRYDPNKALARVLATACRQDYIADENGEPVRRRHCYAVDNGPEQKVFSWFKIEDATPEQMRLSANHRRNGTLLDILQLVRDVKYWNKNHNPGDPLEVDANFQPDVDEMGLSPEYDEDSPNQSDES